MKSKILILFISFISFGVMAQQTITATDTPIFQVEDLYSSEDANSLVVPIQVTFNGIDTTINITKPNPVLPKGGDFITWLEWGYQNLLAGKEWLLLILGLWLPRVTPTVKDTDIFRVISSILDKIGDVLPLLGWLFKNNRAGGGVHVAYPKQHSTPLLGQHVREWVQDGKTILTINQSKQA